MRRPAVLLAVPAALFLLPAPTASAACVSSSGITVCPTVFTCGPGSVVELTVLGLTGSGSASCGGATASCYAFQIGCTAIDVATSAGVLTCSASGRVVATCTASPNASH